MSGQMCVSACTRGPFGYEDCVVAVKHPGRASSMAHLHDDVRNWGVPCAENCYLAAMLLHCTKPHTVFAISNVLLLQLLSCTAVSHMHSAMEVISLAPGR
jgi:hypothetical protein